MSAINLDPSQADQLLSRLLLPALRRLSSSPHSLPLGGEKTPPVSPSQPTTEPSAQLPSASGNEEPPPSSSLRQESSPFPSLSGLSPAALHLLYKRSERHSISSILYWHWRHTPQAIPQTLFSRWQQAYIKNLAHSGIILHQLADLINLLTAQGISVTLLKGAAYSRTIYPDPALRPMTDIDLLLEQSHLPLAVQTLKTAGYRDVQLILNRQDFIERSHHILLEPAAPSQPGVELHWRLIAGDDSRFLPSMDWFYNQRLPWHPENPLVFSLSPAANLLFASAHLALQHGIGLSPLIWFVDIALILEKYRRQIDWQQLLQQARASRWSAAVHACLVEVESRFEVQLPPDIMAALKAQITPFEESYVKAKSTSAQNIALLGWDTMISLSWSARLKTTLAHLFPLPRFMLQRYNIKNPWLLPLYYPYRWIDMLQKLIKGVLLRQKAKSKPPPSPPK